MIENEGKDDLLHHQGNMIGESGDEEWNEFVELAAMHQEDQIPGVDDGIDQQGADYCI